MKNKSIIGIVVHILLYFHDLVVFVREALKKEVFTLGVRGWFKFGLSYAFQKNIFKLKCGQPKS